MEHRCPPSPRAGFTHKCTHFSSQSLVPTTTLFTLVYWESQGQMKFFMAASLCDWFPHVASLVGQRVKNLPAMQKTRVRSLGQEDPLEEDMATHSRILAWRIPWTKEPGGLQYTGMQRVGRDWATNTLTFSLYTPIWYFNLETVPQDIAQIKQQFHSLLFIKNSLSS